MFRITTVMMLLGPSACSNLVLLADCRQLDGAERIDGKGHAWITAALYA
jgi:hypothetical protein